MIRVAVAGFGMAAKVFHAPLIQHSAECELTAVVSSRAAEVEALLPGVKVFGSLDQLLSAQIVDAVVITLPTALHFEAAKACVLAGVHVVVEKPVVTSVDELEQLQLLAAQQGTQVTAFHNRRWDGDFLTAKQLLDRGALGDVCYFESHFDRFRPQVRQRWREQPGAGAGVWFDLGSHLLDQALCLFGVPQAITARCLPLRPGADVADYFHAVLHYPSREVVLHASMLCAAPNLRFRIEGTKGSYIKWGLDPQEDQLKAGLTPADARYGIDDGSSGRLYRGDGDSVVVQAQGCYPQFYQQLAAALECGAPLPVTLKQAGDVVRLLALGEESSRVQKTLPVSLS